MFYEAIQKGGFSQADFYQYGQNWKEKFKNCGSQQILSLTYLSLRSRTPVETVNHSYAYYNHAHVYEYMYKLKCYLLTHQ